MRSTYKHMLSADIFNLFYVFFRYYKDMCISTYLTRRGYVYFAIFPHILFIVSFIVPITNARYSVCKILDEKPIGLYFLISYNCQ